MRNWVRPSELDEGTRQDGLTSDEKLELARLRRCESFFASLECESLDRRTFRTHAEARMAAFQYIEGWYNLRRRHSALGYEPPANHERRYRTAT